MRDERKCLNDLLKLRAEKRKQQIGFESQQQKGADHNRSETAENRKQELHRYAVLLAEAKVDHQQLQNYIHLAPNAPASGGKERRTNVQKAA